MIDTNVKPVLVPSPSYYFFRWSRFGFGFFDDLLRFFGAVDVPGSCDGVLVGVGGT